MKILTPAQMEQFEEDGFLVVEDVLDPIEDIQPIFDEYAVVLDGIAGKLHREGVIKSTYAGMPLKERLTAVCVESGRNFPQYFDFSLPQKDIKRDTPIHVGPAIFRTLSHPRMLDLAEDMIGPEIYSNPVQHIRFKLPPHAVAKGPANGLVSRIPWHQDNGVIMPEADEATILTVWVALTPATLQNGCMQVARRSHRHGIEAHCVTPLGVAMPDRAVPKDDVVALPMKPGSVLLMTQRTVHSSLENQTRDDVRISMDLRYQPIGQATGRPAFAPAGFIARSKAHPEKELHDAAVWARNWHEVRDRLAEDSPVFNRWRSDGEACA